MSQKTLFCDNWSFVKTAFGTETQPTEGWQAVDLPHDWLIYDTGNLYETSTGWYKKTFSYQPGDQQVSLRFEAVYMDTHVYVNGQEVGQWKYGYTTFEFDITSALKEGDNEVVVRVDHHSPNTRWYSGAGIIRNVWLVERPAIHIAPDGVYISTDMDGHVTVSAEVERPADVTVDGLQIRETILRDGMTMAKTLRSCVACDPLTIPEPIRKEGVRYGINTDHLTVEAPALWSLEAPALYTCLTELLQNGTVIDREETLFGFRTIEFTTDQGFFLNKKHVKLHGVCEHHDLGALGAANNKAAIRRKLKTLRTMGVNAIRTSHNPPAVEWLELADEMGFLVINEFLDMWETPKTTYDYARFFPEWIARDTASWVRRDRNHPCVIGWSIGNEIYDLHASERGQEVTSYLLQQIRLYDSRSNAYVTSGSNYMQWEGAQRCADILKVVGYNYAERLYDEQHEAHPDWVIYGSETSSVLQSRGIYHFPLEQQVLTDEDEQCSALGNTVTAWSARSSEACIIPDRDRDYCAGQFIWTGFDYIGEPTPYTTKNSYFGQIDTAGFAKDSAYIFRTVWTDAAQAPFVHIYPYWDFSVGQIIDVRVATNAAHVALYLNDRLVQEQDMDPQHGNKLTMDVKLAYEPGCLKAIAYDADGQEIAQETKYSFGDAVAMQITEDKTELNADGRDLIFVEIGMVDADGHPVENANNRVEVEVTGAGRLIGLDNGDSTDYDSYKGTSRRLFSGKLLAIIEATLESGDICMTCRSEGMADVTKVYQAKSVGPVTGVSAVQKNEPCASTCLVQGTDIPVRMVTLQANDLIFDPDHKTRTFAVNVFPENATYAEDITFKVTTVLGIETKLAKVISYENRQVTVEAMGDGVFYLRATCHNGMSKVHFLTQWQMKAEGLGGATFDPYEFMIGGLFSISRGEVSNGINKGFGFVNPGACVGFENLDFGPLGSDTVEIPVYSLGHDPVTFQIYDGVPGEGGELLADCVFQGPTPWMTHVPATYQLNRVLRGTHHLVFTSNHRFELGGFRFAKPEKETMEMPAVLCETVYGDTYTVCEDAIEGIGNNVVLGFGAYDFTEKKPVGIRITGRSTLPVNSIHVTFHGDTEKRVLAEFAAGDGYVTREFALDGIDGVCEVALTFLPGCQFDCKSFSFVFE